MKRLARIAACLVLISSAGCGGHLVSHAGPQAALPMPQSVSPADVKPAPMAKTAILPPGAMRAPRRTDTAFGGPNWSQLPGSGTAAAAAPDGSLWVLSGQPSGADKYIWHYAGGTWTNISGLADALAVAPDGTLYAINSGGGTYAYKNGAWTALGGGADAITAASDGSIYVLTNSTSGDRAIWHNVNGVWTQIPGSGVAIDASWDGGTYVLSGGTMKPGGLYVLNSKNEIYYGNADGSYVRFPGAASAIAATQAGGVFVLAGSPSTGDRAIYYDNLNAPGWSAQPGAAVSISAGGSLLYAVSSAGGIYSTPITSSAVTPVSLPGGSLNFTGIGSSAAMTLNLSQSGYGGAFSVSIGSCANIVSLSNATSTGVTVTPLFTGSCSLSVSGSGTQSLPVSVALSNAPLSVSWNAIGPRNVSGQWAGSGKLNVLAYDAQHGIYYAGGGYGQGDLVTTEAGLYKSTDNGATWTPIMNGLADPAINALWMDSSTPANLVVTTQFGGIFRSTNGGSSWTQVSTQQQVSQLLQVGSTIYAAAAAGVLQSNDGGATWSVLSTAPAPVIAMASYNNVLYAGNTFGTIYKQSSAGSSTFASVGTLPAPNELHTLAIDPKNGYIFATQTGTFCGFYNQDVFLSTNGGSTWTENSQTCSLTGGVHTMAFDPVNDNFYVFGYGEGVSGNDGSTFTHYYGIADARTLNILPSGTNRFLATSDQGGYISSDGGNYTAITVPLSVNLVRSVSVSGQTIIVTRQDWYPAVSFDGGSTWTNPSNIDTTENGNVLINPGNPQYCYAMDREVNVSSDGCRTFTTSNTGHVFSSYDSQALAVSVQHPGDVYAVAQDGLYASTNYGVSFSKSTWPLSNPTGIIVDPSNDQNIYVSVAGGLEVTHDGGATWHSASGISSNVWIAVSPENPNIVIAIPDWFGNVYRSIDGGLTFTAAGSLPQTRVHNLGAERTYWERLSKRNPAALAGYYSIVTGAAFNPQGHTSALVVTTTNGLYASTDLGTTWQDITGNAISHYFEDVKWQNGYAYVATDGQGVLESAAPLQSTNATQTRRTVSVTLSPHH